jgi:hypothetical protein
MYHILNFYTIVFFKFIVNKINFTMVKSKIVVLIKREKTDVNNADVIVDWIL